MTPESRPGEYEKALEEHESLRRLSEELRQFLGNPRPALEDEDAHDWAASLYRRLVSMHDRVSSHFLAQRTGLLDQLGSRYPEATNRLAKSSNEHSKILGSLRSLVDDAMRYAEAQPPDQPNLRRRTHELLTDMSAHESEVTSLIQDLMWTDIGPAD